ncbi:MAG: hypothetical protein AAB415_01515 [Patescibacteria group bacterium]
MTVQLTITPSRYMDHALTASWRVPHIPTLGSQVAMVWNGGEGKPNAIHLPVISVIYYAFSDLSQPVSPRDLDEPSGFKVQVYLDGHSLEPEDEDLIFGTGNTLGLGPWREIPKKDFTRPPESRISRATKKRMYSPIKST